MINRTDPLMMEIFDTELSKMIAEREEISEMDALRVFMKSEIHSMMENDDLKMWHFSPFAIFDMWEAEVATGNPRNSLYLRGDEVEQGV